MPSRTAATAALALAATTAAALPVAHADGHYFSMGAGPTSVDGELGARTGDGGRVRLAIGHRFGNLAVEGFISPEFLDETSDVEGFGYGVDVRYIVKLVPGVQGYVRGSLSKLSLHDYAWEGEPLALGAEDRSGRGLGGGVGLQLRGRVRALGFLYWPLFFLPWGPKTNAALYIDHGVDFYRLHDATGATGALDAKLTRLTIGFNVGSDF